MLSSNKDSESTPICRCRVLYLGSSVPQQSKDGLQGIQQPLRELYPEDGAAGAKGIDSWLSVWSNGILLENVDENHKKITRFFPIESLHYCAAVRYVLVPEKSSSSPLPSSASASPRFLPLDSPFARAPSSVHPPLFAAILRRTQGIKVLECHAFICRREAAANALVRCCFHAYADSSYAKQTEPVVASSHAASSIYGTLGPSSNNETTSRLEEWRTATSTMGRSISGSTMTIDAVGKDDISIYNGDENHKVWAGSQDNLDGGGGGGIYEAYSTSTVGRTPRPRQVAAPVAVPPPPPPTKEKTKVKSKSSKNLKHHQSTEDLMYAAMANGRPSGGGSSLAGTMPKHVKQHHQVQPQHPLYIVPHPPQQTLPNPKFFKHYGNTFSHRPRGKVLIPGRPVPPPLVPMAPLVLPATATKSRKKNKQMIEEPIYGRAASTYGAIPASYAPPPPPPHEYMMQPTHFATIESKSKSKKNKEKLLNSKKLAQSMNGLDQDPAMHELDENPFDTGIYKRKGHLNERAFSYSIRQEHRSRSYGSLANLKFATPIPNGVPHEVEERGEDLKKEREILQMVQDLDLSGDDLERSEVPRGVYEARGPASPIILSSPQQNGIRHHRR